MAQSQTHLASAIGQLPLVAQIELMQQIAAGEAFNDLTYVITRSLDHDLEALRRDAIDQSADENYRMHGCEVSSLTSVWLARDGWSVAA